MRVIRLVLVLFMLTVMGVLAYNYWTGNGWTLRPPSTSATGIDAERARDKSAELARKAAETTKVAAERSGQVLSETAITAKIKSKMALDDYVKARTINVTTTGTSVTLSGTVHTEQERQRALRLARETEGVSEVVDKLHLPSRLDARELDEVGVLNGAVDSRRADRSTIALAECVRRSPRILIDKAARALCAFANSTNESAV